jgi:hypothetical protein
LQDHIATELSSIYLTKGVKATTAIEGNTLSEEQVRARIKGEASSSPSRWNTRARRSTTSRAHSAASTPR